MKLTKIYNYLLLSMMVHISLYATTEFRTPLDFIRASSSYYYPFESDTQESLYTQTTLQFCRNIIISSGIYSRAATKALGIRNNENKRHKSSLAALWFGKESFKAEETFFGGMITSLQPLQANPAIAFSSITPEFKYSEKGAWIGLHTNHRLGRKKQWNIGFRASLPFKAIEVKSTLSAGSALEEGLGAVLSESIIEVNSGPNNNATDYAYRLDFLSSLIRTSLSTPLPLVQYGTGILPDNTKIGGVVVGSAFVSDPTDTSFNTPPVYLIKSSTGVPSLQPLPGSVPPLNTFAKHQSQVQTTPLPASGASVEGNVYYFDSAFNYAAQLGMDRATQSTLFVVPRMVNAGGDLAINQPNDLSSRAVSIRNAVTELLNQFELQGRDSAVSFLRNNCGIDLAKSERVVGVGDLATEFYWGYGPESRKWYVDNTIGILFPTAQSHKDLRRVFFQPTGNNKHFELKMGIDAGISPCNYCAINGNIVYGHAFKRTEKRAAPFFNATIKNIGVPVDMGVSWDTITGHLDGTFFSSYSKSLGLTVGYEGYYKTKDRIDLCQQRAVDCLGNNQPLDPFVLKKDSSAVSHKIRAEIFKRNRFFECVLGASHVVAGHNVMQETEIHIGAVIYF